MNAPDATHEHELQPPLEVRRDGSMRARCGCGWKDDEWHPGVLSATNGWAEHAATFAGPEEGLAFPDFDDLVP